ncbi:unnamed protein product, partial [Didymodactylos carnosus]
FVKSTSATINAYAYDDGHDGEEHCCVVRMRENFCIGVPITRRLIQVNYDCGKSTNRFGKRVNNLKYLKQINRRLRVQKSFSVGEKTLLELKEVLPKDILDNDLVCLSSKNSSISLAQCHIELATVDQDHNDMDDDETNDEQDRRHHGHRYSAHRRHSSYRHHHHQKHRDDDSRVKREVDETQETASVDTTTGDTEDHVEEKNYRDVHSPVEVIEGRGLQIHTTVSLANIDHRPENIKQRKCWHWYKKNLSKARTYSTDKCIELNDHTEDCINQLIYKTDSSTNDKTTGEEESIVNKMKKPKTALISKGSKLYCENRSGNNKLVGIHRRSRVCFIGKQELRIEHDFEDTASLSDSRKNKKVLKYLAENELYNAEFGDDCEDKTTLVEIRDRAKKTTTQPSTTSKHPFEDEEDEEDEEDDE